MKTHPTLSVSLVLYKSDPMMVLEAVLSVLNSDMKASISIIDNSPSPELAKTFQDLDVDYYYNNGKNIGFGQGHNLALSKLPLADYHLILNPDIYFEEKVLPSLINYLEEDLDVGLISPRVHYPNGNIQYLCKRYPSVVILFLRRFIPRPLQFLLKDYLNWYEMRETGYNKIMEVKCMTGCFMLFRRKYLDEIGWFDQNIFMYLEDFDISIRMSNKYKNIYFPYVFIFHHWGKGSYKSFKLMMVHFRSAMYFFRKHGWRLI